MILNLIVLKIFLVFISVKKKKKKFAEKGMLLIQSKYFQDIIIIINN